MSELTQRVNLKEIKFESWFLGPQTLYLKQQSTSAALKGRKLRGFAPSKHIVEPLKDVLCFYSEVQWEINFSCSPYWGFCLPMPGDRMELSLPRGFFAALRVICLDLMGRAGRKQVLAVLLKLSVTEADSAFQWALSTRGSVCKATVCLSVTSAFQSLASDCLKKIQKTFKIPSNIGLILLTFSSH